MAFDGDDLAVTYAALLLHDSGLNLTPDKLATVLTAAEIEVPLFYCRLYCRVLANRNLDDLIFSVPASAGPATAEGSCAAPAAGASAPAAKEEKKEEKVEEEEEDALGDDGGMSLFGGDDDY